MPETSEKLPYTERELIQRAIKIARPYSRPEPRWAMVKRIFGTGQTVSKIICQKYGFDPDKIVQSILNDAEKQQLEAG